MYTSGKSVHELSLEELYALRDCFMATVCYQYNDYERGDKWQHMTEINKKQWNSNSSEVYHYLYTKWRDAKFSPHWARFAVWCIKSAMRRKGGA